MPENYLISMTELKTIVNLSKPTIYRSMQKAAFPRPVKLSPNRIAWRKCDIDFWIENLPKSIGRGDQ